MTVLAPRPVGPTHHAGMRQTMTQHRTTTEQVMDQADAGTDMEGATAHPGWVPRNPLEDGRAVAAVRHVAHLSVEERVARGKAARNEVPRSSHGRWVPSAARPNPIALLEEQAGS